MCCRCWREEKPRALFIPLRFSMKWMNRAIGLHTHTTSWIGYSSGQAPGGIFEWRRRILKVSTSNGRVESKHLDTHLINLPAWRSWFNMFTCTRNWLSVEINRLVISPIVRSYFCTYCFCLHVGYMEVQVLCIEESVCWHYFRSLEGLEGSTIVLFF